jgi:hypothetical protein
MIRGDIVNYIRDSLARGYDANSITNALLQYGHNIQDIRDSFTSYYSQYNRPAYYPPKQAQQSQKVQQPSQQTIKPVSTSVGGEAHKVHHVIHLSPKSLVFLLLLVVVASFFFFNPFKLAEKELLDYRITVTTKEIQAGDNLIFINKFANMGSKTKYDVIMNYQIKNAADNSILDEWSETKAISLIQEQSVSFNIPEGTKAGNYYLMGESKYKGGIIKSRASFKVYEETSDPSCFDNIKNQDEEDVDCGGICQACESCFDGRCNQDEDCNFILNSPPDCGGSCNECESCPSKCPVDDSCSIGYCNESTNYICAYIKKQNCCGNGLCEAGEQDDCTADCPLKEDREQAEAFNYIDQANSLAESSPEQAKENCDKIASQNHKDSCYFDVARKSKQSKYCSYIVSNTNTERDNCYILFAYDNDFTVCEKIEDGNLNSACDQLSQMYSYYPPIDELFPPDSRPTEDQIAAAAARWKDYLAENLPDEGSNNALQPSTTTDDSEDPIADNEEQDDAFSLENLA